MMNVKVTAKTVTIEIDKATHVFVRAALLGVRLQDVTGPGTERYAPGGRTVTEPAPLTGKVSIALAGGVHLEATLPLDDARRLMDLLTLAMEGGDATHD